MKIKKFDQALHDKYDPPARKAVIDWIQMKWGLQAIDNPDIYGTDLLVCRAGKQVGWAEVEVRQWSPSCPFSTIHVPERKTKFFNGNSLFFALTKDMGHAYWIESKDILKYPLKEVRNVKVTSGELFFDVPTSEFNFVIL